MSAPPRQPFGNITNNPASNSPASGPAKANNVRGATQAGPTTGPTAGSTAGAASAASGSNSYEAAAAAWEQSTQAEKEAVFMKTFGSKQPPWANDTGEAVDDGADLDYEYGPE